MSDGTHFAAEVVMKMYVIISKSQLLYFRYAVYLTQHILNSLNDVFSAPAEREGEISIIQFSSHPPTSSETTMQRRRTCTRRTASHHMLQTELNSPPM